MTKQAELTEPPDHVAFHSTLGEGRREMGTEEGGRRDGGWGGGRERERYLELENFNTQG